MKAMNALERKVRKAALKATFETVAVEFAQNPNATNYRILQTAMNNYQEVFHNISDAPPAVAEFHDSAILLPDRS